ncbi:hypothetical protein F4776DRAFT_611406, partial [Hypoxylon sp. NC0597]
MFIWGWFILTMIFTVATIRASWALLGALVFIDLTLPHLAVGHMLGKPSCLKAGSTTGFISGFCGCKFSLLPLVVNSVPMV